jgi:hypothetical protein
VPAWLEGWRLGRRLPRTVPVNEIIEPTYVKIRSVLGRRRLTAPDLFPADLSDALTKTRQPDRAH